MVQLEELILTRQKSALSELCFFAKDSSFVMMAALDGRARRAGSGVPKISSIRALLFEKDSSSV